MNEHILVVDDDRQVRTLLRNCFELENYEVSEASNRAEAMSLLEAGTVDLITLDLKLGAEDGLSLAREIQKHSSAPIIMVTGKADTIDRVVGLELGADDYITKPFHVREVLARVKSVLRRSHGSVAAGAARVLEASPVGSVAGSMTRSFGHWCFDIAKRELKSDDGCECPLTTAEFDLLRVLVERPHRVLSREQLMDLLKGHEWNPTDRTIDNQIARLRKKIEERPESPKFIKTVRGVGYSFAADVRQTP